VVVGGNRREAARPRCVDGACETRELLPLVAEFHEREMKGEFQTGPILSPDGPLMAFTLEGLRSGAPPLDGERLI
jgi:hypothetical protein